MKLVNEVLKLTERKQYEIEVEVRDARKALDALKDDVSLNFKTKGSNVYVFKDIDDYETAMDILNLIKIPFKSSDD